MTELSFLLDLLLNHNLEKETKDLIANRIREVEEKINAGTPQAIRYQPSQPPMPAAQVQAQVHVPAHIQPDPTPSPVAQSFAAQNALMNRQSIMEMANANKFDDSQMRKMFKPKMKR